MPLMPRCSFRANAPLLLPAAPFRMLALIYVLLLLSSSNTSPDPRVGWVLALPWHERQPQLAAAAVLTSQPLSALVLLRPLPWCSI